MNPAKYHRTHLDGTIEIALVRGFSDQLVRPPVPGRAPPRREGDCVRAHGTPPVAQPEELEHLVLCRFELARVVVRGHVRHSPGRRAEGGPLPGFVGRTHRGAVGVALCVVER